MDPENKSAEHHEAPERFPSREEIRSVFETIIKGRQYKELRVQNDEQGVDLYEIEVPLENGERIEYNYQKATYDYRNKSLPASAQFSASIHMTKYNVDGMPYAGECVANYLDGIWRYRRYIS